MHTANHSDYNTKLYKSLFVVTAYCLKCKRCGTTGVTSLGSRSSRGAAVGRYRKAVPLRTLLIVPKYGKVKVDDVGGGVRGNQIDLRFTNHAKALRWGKRLLSVTVVKSRHRRSKTTKKGYGHYQVKMVKKHP